MIMGGFRGPMDGDVGSLDGEPSRELVLDSPGEFIGDGTCSSSVGRKRSIQRRHEELSSITTQRKRCAL